jgi:hypothetical protein
MTDIVDDNKKPIITFSAQQARQEVNESKIKFHFATKERQLKLNFGKKVDPEQQAERFKGRYQRNLVLNLTKGQLQNMTFSSAIVLNVYPVYDDFGKIIPPGDPRFLNTKPIRVTIQTSEHHPFPLSRFDKWELDNYITDTFGKFIISEFSSNKATHDEHFKGLEDIAFSHSTILQNNEATGKDDLNKNAFNVYGAKIFDHELNYLNKKLEMIGAKPIKHNDALYRTEKTIEKPAYDIFELGEN